MCLFSITPRSRGSRVQHHIQRRTHWWQCSYLCQKHSSSRGSHPRWPIESWRPAAGGEAALSTFSSSQPSYSVHMQPHSVCSVRLYAISETKCSFADMVLFQKIKSYRAFVEMHCFPYSYNTSAPALNC